VSSTGWSEKFSPGDYVNGSICRKNVLANVFELKGWLKRNCCLGRNAFRSDVSASYPQDVDGLLKRLEMSLAIFFGDFEQAAKLAIEMGDTFEKKMFPAYWLGMMNTFHRGVAMYAMARRTKKRKYKKHAMQIGKVVQNGHTAGILMCRALISCWVLKRRLWTRNMRHQKPSTKKPSCWRGAQGICMTLPWRMNEMKISFFGWIVRYARG
jgi:hypothetical protein